MADGEGLFGRVLRVLGCFSADMPEASAAELAA
jgi:hypothetical protein